MGLVGGILQTAGNFASQAFQQDWNSGMYEKQKQFWYEQQDYNSPANQVRRLEEAGLNPQLMLGNIQSGQMGSSPSVPTMSAAQAGSFAGATDSILSIINNKKQQKILDAEARVKNADAFLDEIDSFTKFAKNIQDIRESLSRENKNFADAFLSGVTANVSEMMAGINADEAQSRIELNWLNYAKGLVELKYLPAQQQSIYLERMAEIAKIKAETSESKQRKQRLIQETNKEFFKAQGEKFINELNKKTERYLIEDRAYAPTRGMSASGAAATIGNRIGSAIKDFVGFE